MHKIVKSSLLFTWIVAIAMIGGSGIVSAQLTFYADNATGAPANCTDADYRLNPPLTISGATRSIAYYCLDVSGDINNYIDAAAALSDPAQGCTGGAAGLNLGEFGFYCLPTSTTSPIYKQPYIIQAQTSGGASQDEGPPPAPVSDELKFSNEDGERVFWYLQSAINLLTALAGIAISGAVIVAGIQYSTAGGNPQAAAQAKSRIINAMIALLALLFLYTFFQWIVPGGIFG